MSAELRILVLDDQIQNLRLIQKVLPTNVAEIFSAKDMEEAAHLLSTHRVDLMMIHLAHFEDNHLLLKELQRKSLPWISYADELPDNAQRLKLFKAGTTGFLLIREFPSLLMAKVRVYVKLFRGQLSSDNDSKTSVLHPTIFFELDANGLIRSTNENPLAMDPKGQVGLPFIELLSEESQLPFEANLISVFTELAPREMFLKIPNPLSRIPEEYHFRITPMGVGKEPSSYLLSGLNLLRKNEEYEALNIYNRQLEELIQNRMDALKATNNALISEIRDKEAAKESLRRQQELTGALVDSLPVGIFLQDETGRMILSNKAANEIFDPQGNSIIGKKYQDFLDPATAELYRKEELEILRTQIPQVQEECVNLAGEKNYFIFGRTPLQLSGQRQLILGFRLKINDRKQLEDRLLQSKKMEAIGTMAGGIAHDFNNFLFAILLNINLAKNYYQAEPGKSNYLEQAEKACVKAKELILQILSFSRSDQGTYQSHNLVEVLQESVNLIQSGYNENIKIQLTALVQQAFCNIDPTQIHQVLLNLCTNAAYYLKESGGLIQVRLEEGDARDYPSLEGAFRFPQIFKISVIDQGPGISEENLNKIFDPFFTTKSSGQGSGIGLSVVHGIIRKHKGVITCDSKLGQGTRFDIFLPQAERDLYISSSQNHTQELPQLNLDLIQGVRVILVDDQEMILEAESKRLEGFGLKVSSTNQPKEALRWIQESPFGYDLLITDLSMPEMTGDELAKQVLRIKPDFPILLITGFPNQGENPDFYKIGIKEVLIKPVLSNTMLQSIYNQFAQPTHAKLQSSDR